MTDHSSPALHRSLEWSGALQRCITGKPAFAQWLADHAQETITRNKIEEWFRDLSGQTLDMAVLDATNCKRTLRQLRQRVFFLCMVRDINQVATLEEVTGAMTLLADICVEQAYRSVMADMVSVHGKPIDPESGLPQEMIIIGMGKLGGGELNVSSDIDLVMLYGEEGETTGPRKLSHHEFYGRLTRKMMPLISEIDADGQVFRTDLRLRPDGDAGPLAWSLDAFEQYLFTQGREWERYAWLKGRSMPARAFPNSDSSAALQHMESMRQPFVYRKYFDFDALSALRELRERIRQDWERRALSRPGLESDHNIKLGNGGIREIEFVVQLTQLIRGGKMPALQQRGLLDALDAQQRAGLLPKAASEALAQAYIFLRKTEHMLQYREDAQTHVLPSEPILREGLARALGMSLPSFENTLAHHRAFVEDTFKNAFRLAGLGEVAEEKAEKKNGSHHHPDSLGQSSNDQAHGRLADANSLNEMIGQFGEQSAELDRRVESLFGSHRIRSLSGNARKRVDTLLPIALRAARDTSHPLAAALHMLDMIETIAQRSAYLALLAEYPDIVARVARMMAASPWAAQYLIQHPVVLDSLIDWRTLMVPINFHRAAQVLRADLDACLLPDGSPDIENQMNIMRDNQRQLSFQLLAQDLAGVLSVEKLADDLSALADMLLEESLHRVWQIIAKPPLANPHESPRMAIIAYGKLGGKELGYSSDLDLVYVHDDPREEAVELYAKLGRRLTSWLSTMTSSGRLYEVDLRLRPDGDAGLLAVSLDAFEQYQFKHAWPWEHQALTRARFAAGNAQVGERFESIRQHILIMPRDAVTLGTAVRQMREKITAGHPNHSQDFDLKHDRGGMVDLEFVTQYLVLLYAREHPDLIKNLGNIALLNLAGQAGLISRELALKSGDAYRSLRRRQHELRLQGADKARVPPGELSEERAVIRQLWDAVLG